MPRAGPSVKTPKQPRRAGVTSATRPPKLPNTHATKPAANARKTEPDASARKTNPRPPARKTITKTGAPARQAKPRAPARETKTGSPARKTIGAGARKTIGAGAKETGGARASETTVVIVGAGRLGSALALALDAAGGYRVIALVSRRRARSLRAARRLRHGALALSADDLDKLPASDLLVIATPDDQIELTAARLAAALPPAVASPPHVPAPASPSKTSPRPRATKSSRAPVALHASGALSSEALSSMRARGFRLGSLHPLVSVSDSAAAAARGFGGVYFCVEGEPAAARAARRIVRALGGRAFSVRAQDKPLYHAAAVFAAGHAVALFDIATHTLAACGLKPDEARRVLLPLARSNLANLAAAPSNERALTGPFARGDAATVRRHLDAFAARDFHGLVSAYVELGFYSLSLALRAGVDEASLTEIARAMSEAREASMFAPLTP